MDTLAGLTSGTQPDQHAPPVNSFACHLLQSSSSEPSGQSTRPSQRSRTSIHFPRSHLNSLFPQGTEAKLGPCNTKQLVYSKKWELFPYEFNRGQFEVTRTTHRGLGGVGVNSEKHTIVMGERERVKQREVNTTEHWDPAYRHLHPAYKQ